MAAEFDNQYNLDKVLANQYNYVNEKYTAESNAQAAMLNAELERAKKAVEGEGFGFLLIKDKLDRMMPSELMREEFLKVTIDTLTSAIQPFLNYLETNEVAFNPEMFQEAINSNAKQLFYAQLALKKESEQSQSGQKFSATY